jgi:benzoate-CoA ligase family protein
MSTGNAVERFVLAPAAAAPDAVAVIDGPSGVVHSRGDVATGAARVAATLTGLGVQPEQRVMLCLADTVAFLHWFWGAMQMGAVPVPVSTMLTEGDYRFLLQDSRAVGLVLSPPFASTAGAAASDQPFLRWTMSDTDDLVPAEGAPPLFPSTADDIAFWLYTSGTTGFPKGAMHRHADMGACTDGYALGVLGMGPDDVVYSVAKLFFAYGLGNAGYFPAATGAQVVLNPARPVPEEVAEQVRRHRPTLFFGVPTFYAGLLASDVPDDSFASVRSAVSAGEPLPAELHRRIGERFGMEVLDGLGTTEVAHIFLSNRPGASVPGTTGTPVPGYEIELRDALGAPVADGEPGALFVAGESVTVGYWNRTARNREAIVGRFMATGDTYMRQADGNYVCLGRTDDMLKVGGMWVSPTEVEACIMELDVVLQAAVVGWQDEAGLVKPKAFVVPATDGTEDLPALVQQHVKQRLAPYKYPRWVEVRSELPVTATGKVKRYLLRQ